MATTDHIPQERLDKIRAHVRRSEPGYGHSCHDDMADLLDEIALLQRENAWLADQLADMGCPHGCPNEDPPSLEDCANCWREAARKAVDEQ